MSWSQEFSPEYQVPAEIESLHQQGLAEDMSWHNDVCPSFGGYVKAPISPAQDGEYEVRIWVDHPDPNKREIPTNPRFLVTYMASDGGDMEVLANTDSVQEAIAAYTKAIGSRPLNKAPAAHQVDSETRLYDLHTKKKRFSLTPEEEQEMSTILRQRGKLPGYMASWIRSTCKFGKQP